MKNHILVTSAKGEIGTAIVTVLTNGGSSVITASRSKTDNITDRHIQELDFESIDSINTFCETNKELLREVNAVVLIPPRIEQSNQALPTAAEWQKILTRTFVGPMELIRIMVNKSVNDGWRLNHVVTISGFTTVQIMGKYAQNSAIRLAMLGAFKSASHIYGPAGIKFNTISVGGLQTGKFHETVTTRAKRSNRTIAEQYEHEYSNVPLRSYTTAESVGNLVRFVLSSDCDGITGHNFVVDNGFTSAY